jgi:hypothetical protein
VERIYFLDASGPLKRDGEYWVSRSAVPSDQDFDAIEVWRDGQTLAVVRKRFFKQGRVAVEISYDKLERREAHWIARHVRLVSGDGYSLELEVTEYDPRFPVPDDKLHV